MDNMFETNISEQDIELGFAEIEIENPDAYYAEPKTIKAVVKQISSVERVIKIKSIIKGEEYLHQWKKDDEWQPCCHNDIQRKNLYEGCNHYNKFEKLIRLHGEKFVEALTLKIF